jgi:hypothetical protein
MLITQLKYHGLQTIESVENRTDTMFRSIDIEENLELERKKNLVKSSAKEYRRIERITDWNEHHVGQFFIDNNLNCLLSILKGIDGQGLIELHRVYERSPESLYQMFNKDGQTVSLGIFFKFIGAFKKYTATIEQTVYF